MSENKNHAPRRREFLSASAKTLAGATAASIFAGEALASPLPLPNAAEATVRACQAAFAARDFEAAAKLTSPNLVEHAPLLVVKAHEFMMGPSASSPHPPIEDIQNFLRVFPDAEVRIEDIFADKDKAVYRWKGSGTHLGEFLGIAPTGKRVSLEGMTIARVENGQIVETWRQFEFLGALEQLNLVDKALDIMRALQ